MTNWRKFVNGAPVTAGLVTVNVVVFVLMVAVYHIQGVSLFSTFSGQSLLAAGARYTPAIQAGQWWRLFTPMFIHMSVMHLGMNMVVLYFLGQQIETLFGHWRLLIIYLVSGMTGNIWSAIFLPTTLSAGASTSIFGLFGAFIMLGIIFRGNPYIRAMSRQFILLVVLNLVMDIFSAGIDIWGHIGGLVGGFAIALVIGVPTARGQIKWIWRGLGGLALLAICAIGLPLL